MKSIDLNEQQLQQMKTHPGFIAALDQSGGSTPSALRLYGIKEGAWSNEDEMFAIVHQMRTRMITSPGFTGEWIIGTILFENTMDRHIEGQPTADYLWNVKRVVPFLKVDKGLATEKDGVQLMKPMPALTALLEKAKAKRIFGTKMRSVIKQASEAGIKDIVNQQFELAAQIIAAGLVPIVEPEVLFDGTHTIDQCEETITRTYDALFAAMKSLRVHMPGTILKTSMVLPGKDSGTAINHDDVAERTVKALHDHVPHDLGGVVFLSGGQTSNDAFINLNRIVKKDPHPWGITFSYSRAIQDPVLKAWAKNRSDREGTQNLFKRQLELVGAASEGKLDESQLQTDTAASHAQDL